MNARQCPDDLLVAARLRRLSELERQALSAHLARCEACHAGELAAELLHQRLVLNAAVPGADRALVERVAERASASLARDARHAHWGWRRVAAAVAVFLGLGGVASAWIGRNFVSPRAVAPVDGPPVSSGSRAAPRAHRSESSLAPAPTSPSRPVAPAKKLAAARPARDVSAAVTSPETAASLFAEAARARHDGDLRRAVGLYGTLRTTFPDSDQARVASVSMGPSAAPRRTGARPARFRRVSRRRADRTAARGGALRTRSLSESARRRSRRTRDLGAPGP
jgi:hypothetical protein